VLSKELEPKISGWYLELSSSPPLISKWQTSDPFPNFESGNIMAAFTNVLVFVM
jgi:hypothetical protein